MGARALGVLAAGLWFALLTSPAHAVEKGTAPAETGAVLEVFVREGCPHCADAKAFLPGFLAERPWLRVVYRPVDRDEAAREDLMRYSRGAGAWPPGVPTFVYNGYLIVGFESPERTGPALADLVEGTPDAPAEPGAPTVPRSVSEVDTTLFGPLSVSRLGLPLFTLALGLLDGFNPCAMWVLLFLLSMLVHLRDRARMALIAGTFVLVGGAVYYAFMAAWLNVFLAVGLPTLLRLILAAVAVTIGAINLRDFFVERQGFTLSIPDSAKPGLYARMRQIVRAEHVGFAIAAAAALAVVVNIVELLCTAGFPALYTAILTQQDLGAAAHYGYLGLYILGYIADDTLMVTIAVIFLGSRRLTRETGRWLKFISGAVMLGLGLVLVLRPGWLL
ncbi:glutaredoxin domain-containing protein [uncultured Abyssibacter sp.]|uniref:glutaredoxin domain-containing protein n=1 Tax=uncultured Abyssibacter sp. TaxID=2320202 RepID=UPI0032B1D633